jgi:predicted signal transduction protein with EAL and GGDEF domain
LELYPPETFRTLLEHEVHMSHRYGDSLSLVDMVVETDPSNAQALHSAEVFTINMLNLHLRNTDIPCQKGNEFLILMPASGLQGARTACERLIKLMDKEPQSYDRVSFKLLVFMGLASLPYDRSVSSDDLIEHAAQALWHARTNRLKSVVSFSEVND